MSSVEFFSGNERTLLIKKQVDKDTPVSDWTDAMALRVYELTKDPVRQIQSLAETDATAQQGASKVASIGTGLSFGLYGRPSELDLIAELLLGENDDSATTSPTTHTATPNQDAPWFSLMDVLPYGTADKVPVYDGCRIAAASFTAQDAEGDTFLKATGLQVLALGITHGATPPSPLPVPADEDPFIYAEAEIKYGGVHLGSTKSFTLNVVRNSIRAQGDAGFRAQSIIHGKFQVDGQVSRYTQDDEIMRLIDTGTTTGTDPTATVAQETLSIAFSRGAGASLRQFAIASAGISYEGREEAIDPSAGNPYVEVLGFRTQPQPDIADNISIVTVNAKATTEG